MMSEQITETVLDAKGLACPLPLLKMKLALNNLSPGQKLVVWTTDEGSIRDFQSYCAISEHSLLSVCQTGTHIEFVIQKRLTNT